MNRVALREHVLIDNSSIETSSSRDDKVDGDITVSAATPYHIRNMNCHAATRSFDNQCHSQRR
ncbi:hypothetical protein ACFFYR_15675 [Paraburkholderia dipogonis]|uniref:hypothetical protein n=1 Tax=Paraburkholderia dipogonis TaxID=1211383 RepID=UPI0035E8A3C0